MFSAFIVTGNITLRDFVCQPFSVPVAATQGDTHTIVCIARQTESMKVDQKHVYVYLTVRVLLPVAAIE